MAQRLRALTNLPESPASSQHGHSGSQPSVTPVPQAPTPFPGLHRLCIHMVHRLTRRQNTRAHNKNFKIL